MIDLTQYLRPNDTILIGQGTAEPRALVEALIEQRHRLAGVSVVIGASYAGLFKPEHADAIRFIGLGGVGTSGVLTRAGVLDVLPVHLPAVAQLIRTGALKIDAAFVQTTPIDGSAGTRSLGLTADFARAAVDCARVVLVEENPRVPFTFGHAEFPSARVTASVVDDRPLITMPSREPTATDNAIAEHIATLIPDRATLQLGIGATMDAVIGRLRDRQGLGIHTGLMTDALLDLVEAGAVTNQHKGADHGLTVTGLLWGTDRLYRWADRNERLLVHGTEYTHDLAVLGRLAKFHAVNSAIEVDLTGQVNAEVAAGTHVGTIGGHGAFTRVAAAAADGRSIVALSASARDGAISRIVKRLDRGTVTTPRADADVVVTEFGVAHLRGLTESARRKAMIALAAPQHREELARDD